MAAAWEHAAGRTILEAELLRELREYGYCHLESVLDRDRVAFVERLIVAVRDAGWPPVFAFVYDELWSLAWQSPIRRIAEIALAGPVSLIPHLAVHYVPATGKARGWNPHVDGRGLTGRLTTWVPLTDATLTNGCMYVVPNRAPLRKSLERFAQKDLAFEDVQRLLQNTRALPADAGSVLCWGFEVLHWGSVRQDSPAPRVSVAFEWIARNEAPLPNEVPLLDLEPGPPRFADRLRYICRGICAYAPFDPDLARFTTLAEELLTDLE